MPRLCAAPTTLASPKHADAQRLPPFAPVPVEAGTVWTAGEGDDPVLAMFGVMILRCLR